MAFFQWKDTYSVGIKVMDNQHKRLVSLVEELFQAMQAGRGSDGAGKVLRGLVEYTKTHFRTEEDLMEAHKYPGLLAHRKEHLDLTAQALRLLESSDKGRLTVPLETGKFLKEWLETHILGSDKKLGGYLVRCGVK